MYFINENSAMLSMDYDDAKLAAEYQESAWVLS